ncbi:Hypothetical protein D9617_48g089400 [Elsinoe fawcettii]|nr:Hypothetical protein D9617_48g089400 [Elsinoe fawcettii]
MEHSGCLSILLLGCCLSIYNGNLNFGSNRAYMNERTALHEIAHALGIGQTSYFDANCATDNWPNALALMRSWDGQAAGFSCGGGHFWLYGLNYDTEWSEDNGNRHVRIIGQMIRDGLQGHDRELPSLVGGAGASSTEAVAAPAPETASVLPTTTVEAVPNVTSEVVPEPTSEVPVTTPAPTVRPTAVPTKPSAGLPARTRTRRRRPTRRPWWGPRVGGARTQV